MLLNECAKAEVRVVTGAKARQIVREGSGFAVQLDDSVLHAGALVIATGGLSIPKMGATGFGYDVARQFGVPIREPRPALVPFVLGGEEHASFSELTGVSADVVASVGKRRFREKLLFTHRGLSGPAILQISSYWNGADPVLIDWAPGQEILGRPARVERRPQPRRSPSRASGKTPGASRRSPAGRPCPGELDATTPSPNWSGACTPGLSRPPAPKATKRPKSPPAASTPTRFPRRRMECRDVPGLYFIGEVVDVTGHLGGFNFQWAWASGAAAGRAV